MGSGNLNKFQIGRRITASKGSGMKPEVGKLLSLKTV